MSSEDFIRLSTTHRHVSAQYFGNVPVGYKDSDGLLQRIVQYGEERSIKVTRWIRRLVSTTIGE